MKLLLCALCVSALELSAATITNFTMLSIQGQAVTKQIPLKAGESLGLVQCLANYYLTVSITVDNVRVDDVRAFANNSDPRQFTRLQGPGVVEIKFQGDTTNVPSGQYRAIIALDIDGTATPEGPPVHNIPSNAVVIPADAGGPVQVLLESSTDLITWNSALPGTYGTSTTNRFFRVRTLR